jgi:hypothetical protein
MQASGDYPASGESVGWASQGNCKTSDLLSHIKNTCWGYWEHWSSLECYWKDSDAEVDSDSAAEGVGCHSTARMGDVAGTDCGKGPDHDSTDQKEASVDYPAGNQYADECYYQKSVPEAFSSWHPFPCACCPPR